MRRARRRHSRTEARTDEARFDSSVPVRIRVAVLKAVRVFASDWAVGDAHAGDVMARCRRQAACLRRRRAAWRRRVDAAALAWRAERVVAVVPPPGQAGIE
ncbi:hypothetical protein BUH_6217 [Burkholderia pseudomallei Pakistan 9]|nr:hypothetical protein BUH_6217 [Burkholderia pseudomallei Pakistan 9]ONB83047.1 hypothetical protein AQ907_10180 [Burkholderia pseudomallei]